MVFRIELGLLQKLTFKGTETEKCSDRESFHIFKVIEFFFKRNFYFVFINKHNILQVSLYHLITNCNSESLFGNSLQQKPVQYRNNVIYFELISLRTIRVNTKSYFRTEYINPPITHPLLQ